MTGSVVTPRALPLRAGLLAGRLRRAALALCGAATIVVLAAAAPAHAAFLTQWGSGGSGNGQFAAPLGVATDAAGNVYVADSSAWVAGNFLINDRIQKFTSSGKFITEWGSFGPDDGQFSIPAGVATDSAGNVYVVDQWNSRIQKFTSSGEFITKWGSFGSPPGDGQFEAPNAIATDAAGNVYVVDLFADRIQKFTSSGEFLGKWGRSGSGNGEFNGPTGIDTDAAGNVYVADSINDRIQKFTSSGAFITKWGRSGSGNGEFGHPLGLATDPEGNVYVGEGNNNRIQKFTPSGAFITKWGHSGTGEGEFCGPTDLATDSAGNVYVADVANNRIQKFSPESNVGEDVPGPIVGETFNICSLIGVVKFKCPGDEKFRVLQGGDQLPVGCVIDTRDGTVALTSARGSEGRTQSSLLRRGRFRVHQKKGPNPYTTLKLAGSLGCGKGEGSAAGRAIAAGRRKGRRLWGKGKGRFRIPGRKSAASTRGTTWVVVDRCNGTTVTKVKEGSVKVRDFTRKRTVTVKAGETYVAGR